MLQHRTLTGQVVHFTVDNKLQKVLPYWSLWKKQKIPSEIQARHVVWGRHRPEVNIPMMRERTSLQQILYQLVASFFSEWFHNCCVLFQDSKVVMFCHSGTRGNQHVYTLSVRQPLCLSRQGPGSGSFTLHPQACCVLWFNVFIYVSNDSSVIVCTTLE